MAKSNVGRDTPKVTSAAQTVPWAPQQHVRDREGHTTVRALWPVIATEKVLMCRASVTNAQPTESDLFMPFSTVTGWPRFQGGFELS